VLASGLGSVLGSVLGVADGLGSGAGGCRSVVCEEFEIAPLAEGSAADGSAPAPPRIATRVTVSEVVASPIRP